MDWKSLSDAIAGMNGTDAEIAAAMNAKTITVQGDISVAEALTWCASVGALAAIADTAQTQGHPLRSACLAAMTMFGDLGATFALSSPRIQQLIGGFISGGIITQAQAVELLGLGQRQVSRAEQIGWGNVGAGDVGYVRSIRNG